MGGEQNKEEHKHEGLEIRMAFISQQEPQKLKYHKAIMLKLRENNLQSRIPSSTKPSLN